MQENSTWIRNGSISSADNFISSEDRLYVAQRRHITDDNSDEYNIGVHVLFRKDINAFSNQ